MEYKFETYDWAGTKMYGIITENYPLTNLSSWDWTSEKIQEIIDGVKSTDSTQEEYRWANEDIMLISNKHAVFFIDLLSTRGGGNKIKEKQDLDLTHDEFIKFMEDFKKFIEKENEK
jgi:hypothetical protein